MKRIVFAVILIFLACSIHAQKKNKPQLYRKNTLFIEILGNSATFTLNYDRLLIQSKGYKIAGRIGYSVLPGVLEITSIPFEISILVSDRGNHHLEIGSGLSYIKGLEKGDIIYDFTGSRHFDSESLYLPFRIGYRYQRLRGRLFFKAGIVPMVGIYEFEKEFNRKSYVWLGGAIGYSF